MAAIWLILTCIFFSSCGGGKQAGIEDFVKSRLGIPEADYEGGVVDLKSYGGVIVISYRYNPLNLESAEKEISAKLADTIRDIFYEYPYLNSVNFIIILPSQASTGHTEWKPAFNFRISRNLHNKINWDNIDKETLIDLADSYSKF